MHDYRSKGYELFFNGHGKVKEKPWNFDTEKEWEPCYYSVFFSVTIKISRKASIAVAEELMKLREQGL